MGLKNSNFSIMRKSSDGKAFEPTIYHDLATCFSTAVRFEDNDASSRFGKTMLYAHKKSTGNDCPCFIEFNTIVLISDRVARVVRFYL